MPETVPPPKWTDSLPVRLLVFVIGVILFVELIIFIPSAVSFRDNWIDERLQGARVAALALEAAPNQSVSDGLAADLLENAEVLTVAIVGVDTRQLLISPQERPEGRVISINRTNESWFTRVAHTAQAFSQRRGVLMNVSSSNEMMAGAPVAVGANRTSDMEEVVLEVLIPEAPLSRGLADFSRRILGLSLLISIVAGALVYLVLDALVVRPMRAVTASIVRFRNDPSQIHQAYARSTRKDEIGRAENALADMETVVSDAFRQRERLAQLGEAVAKINHDLRNSLAAAQLVSEGLSNSEDPRVKRAAPRLERALERAINLAQNTLQYGKSEPAKPNLQPALLCEVIEEAGAEALSAYPEIKWSNEVKSGTARVFDPDHMHRIIANLVRNAAQATSKARPSDGAITVSCDGDQLVIQDNGPGLPEKTLKNLFKPFASSSTKGGTGLGLAIARELSQAMGGDLELGNTGAEGTAFVVTLPSSSG